MSLTLDFENSIATGFVNGGELIEPTGAEFQVLDIDLHGLAGLSELAPAARRGPIALEGYAWHR